jgi:hypothetical protein
MYVDMHICIYAYMYVCMYVCMCVERDTDRSEPAAGGATQVRCLANPAGS